MIRMLILAMLCACCTHGQANGYYYKSGSSVSNGGRTYYSGGTNQATSATNGGRVYYGR